MKIFTKLLGLFILLLISATFSYGQSNGDYRTKASGNWSDILNWEKYDGFGWVPAIAPPDWSNGVITILNDMIIDSDLQLDQAVVSGATLTVDIGKQLNILNSGAANDLSIGVGSQFNVYGILRLESGNVAINGHIMIGTSGAPGTLRRIAGTISAASGKLTYDAGSTLEYLGGSISTGDEFTLDFPPTNLTIDTYTGTDVITLSQDAKIDGNLALTKGILSLGSNNLTLGASATATGISSASNMVVATGTGQLRKKYSAINSFTFPVGDNTGNAEYSPVSVNFTAGTFAVDAYVGVNLRNIKHPNNPSVLNYLNRYWTVIANGITSYISSPIFTFVDADVAGTERNKDNIYTGQYDSLWILRNQSSGNNLSATDISSFNDFTGGDQSTMPVNLSSFTFSVSTRSVILNWITASESNNAGFELERTGINQNGTVPWTKIGYVKGKGNTNTVTTYAFEDKNLNSGKYKYRLKQIDYNGNYEYFDLNGEVTIAIPLKFELSQNYPNPFNPVTKINYSISKASNITLIVYDITGRELSRHLEENLAPGNFEYIWDGSKFASGTYFYKIITGNNTAIRKMILLK